MGVCLVVPKSWGELSCSPWAGRARCDQAKGEGPGCSQAGLGTGDEAGMASRAMALDVPHVLVTD